MKYVMFNFNKNCFWSHDYEQWDEPVSRPWKKYNNDTLYERYYQRRTCKRCGAVEERRIIS